MFKGSPPCTSEPDPGVQTARLGQEHVRHGEMVNPLKLGVKALQIHIFKR